MCYYHEFLSNLSQCNQGGDFKSLVLAYDPFIYLVKIVFGIEIWRPSLEHVEAIFGVAWRAQDEVFDYILIISLKPRLGSLSPCRQHMCTNIAHAVGTQPIFQPYTQY
jgi:hypothetical protein